MPLQNRVDPWGKIVAHPARGMLMGNRGCLHDDAGRIVYTSERTAWISCRLSWPGIRRRLMAPGKYTELFFLDEATALATGHRPCGSCRPDALERFKRAWRDAHGLAYDPRVAEIDVALRNAPPLECNDVATVADGTMIGLGARPILRWRGGWLTWTFEGYTLALDDPTFGTVLTPEPIVKVLSAGYEPLIHSSAEKMPKRLASRSCNPL